MFAGRWSLFGVSCSLLGFSVCVVCCFFVVCVCLCGWVVGGYCLLMFYMFFGLCRSLFACCCVVCVVCRLFVGDCCWRWLLLVVWCV